MNPITLNTSKIQPIASPPSRLVAVRSVYSDSSIFSSTAAQKSAWQSIKDWCAKKWENFKHILFCCRSQKQENLQNQRVIATSETLLPLIEPIVDAAAPPPALIDVLLNTVRTEKENMSSIKEEISSIEDQFSVLLEKMIRSLDAIDEGANQEEFPYSNILTYRLLATYYIDKDFQKIKLLVRHQESIKNALQTAEQRIENAEELERIRALVNDQNEVAESHYWFIESLFSAISILTDTAKASLNKINPADAAYAIALRHFGAVELLWNNAQELTNRARNLGNGGPNEETIYSHAETETLIRTCNELLEITSNVENEAIKIDAHWLSADARARPAMHAVALPPQGVPRMAPLIELPPQDGHAMHPFEQAIQDALNLQRRNIKIQRRILRLPIEKIRNTHHHFQHLDRDPAADEYSKILVQEHKYVLYHSMQPILNKDHDVRLNIIRSQNETLNLLEEVPPAQRNARWDTAYRQIKQTHLDFHFQTAIVTKYLLEALHINAQMTVRILEDNFTFENVQHDVHARESLQVLRNLRALVDDAFAQAETAYRDNNRAQLDQICDQLLDQVSLAIDADEKLESAWIETTTNLEVLNN